MEPPRLPVYANIGSTIDSGRYSSADTIATRQSNASFAPPHAGVEPSDRNLPFKKPGVFEEQPPAKILNEKSLFNDDFNAYYRKKRRRRVILVILLIALFGILGAVGYLLTAEGDDNAPEQGNNGPVVTSAPTTLAPTTPPPTTLAPTTLAPTTAAPTTAAPTNNADFCSTQGVTDVSMRELLRDNFNNAFNSGDVGQAFYSLTNLVCLPKSAWDLLSNDQKNIMADLNQGIRISNSLRSIHPDAFDLSLVQGHLRLNLFNNFLTGLPDGVFRNFQSMNAITLGGNPFVTLNNDITGNLPNLQIISMINMDDLVEFPEFMKFSTKITIVSMFDCIALSTANAEAFEDLPITTLNLRSGTTPILNQLGLVGLAEALQLDSAVIEAQESTAFCSSFGSTNDDEVRQLIASGFDDVVESGSGNELVFTNFIGKLPCLPQDAFSLLDVEQQTRLGKFTAISFLDVGIARIHQEAFDIELFGGYQFLNLNRNLMTALPNQVFASFPNLFSLGVGCPFVTLNNNIFAQTGAPSLSFLAMNGADQLISFPEAMLFTPNLTGLQLRDTPSLSKFNKDAFGILIGQLTQILLSEDTPVVKDPGVEVIAETLEIDVAVINVQ